MASDIPVTAARNSRQDRRAALMSPGAQGDNVNFRNNYTKKPINSIIYDHYL
jgi:hypothetical protein